MLSANPSLTPAQVKAKLQSSARPFPTTGGTAGIAGDVTGITATRIAAIIAVNSTTTSSNLTAANAVAHLKDVTANAIGADVNGDGLFSLRTDVGGNGFVLGTGDDIIDGLVIALASGFDAATVKTLTFPAVLV